MQTQPIPPPPHVRGRHYKYYDLVMAGFIAVLLCSNLIGPAKVCQVTIPWLDISLNFGAGNIFFPIGFIFGDILTEIYGYARARKVIWAGFSAMLFATIMSYVIIALPASPSEPYNEKLQPALELVFGNTGRIVFASLVAYWVGDFTNSFVLAKMKLWSNGQYLWMRTIGSTIAGQGVDSLLFYPLAFAGIWATENLMSVVIFNFLFKVSVEVLATPLTYLVVGFLKRAENEDFYDTDTDFTPFSLRD